jgi:ferredoxin
MVAHLRTRRRRGAGGGITPMPKIIFISPEGAQTAINIAAGTTILQAAWDNNIDVEGACEGCMACSTCHVIIGKDHFDQLPAPSDEEEDLLDLAWGVRPTSRLGCQLAITDALDGIEVMLPATTNNQM